jgi:hypothetical protein
VVIQYWPFQRVKGGGELRGRHCLGEGNEEGGRWFGSATHAWRRAADGDARRSGVGGSGETKEEGPDGPVLG